jgi:hypothetical protein
MKYWKIKKVHATPFFIVDIIYGLLITSRIFQVLWHKVF